VAFLRENLSDSCVSSRHTQACALIRNVSVGCSVGSVLVEKGFTSAERNEQLWRACIVEIV
jgi:hypothetical protein